MSVGLLIISHNNIGESLINTANAMIKENPLTTKIISAVLESTSDELYENALKLNMSVIVEVHTKDEAKKSIKFENAIIGINNRNLKTLETDMNTAYDIHDILTVHKGPLISESGIKTKEHLLEITKKTKIKTFLIGESLLKNLEKNSIFSVL